MSSLGIVTDGVTSSESHPVRNRLVLLLLNSKSALGAERLLGWLQEMNKKQIKIT
jgi:hypothetical protein